MFHFHSLKNHQCLTCFNRLACRDHDFEDNSRHWCDQTTVLFIVACSCFDSLQCEDSSRMVDPPHVTNFGNMGPCFASIFEVNADASIFSRMSAMIRKGPYFRCTLEQNLMRFTIVSELVLHQGYLLLSVWKGLTTPAGPARVAMLVRCIPVVSATAAVMRATFKLSSVGLYVYPLG